MFKQFCTFKSDNCKSDISIYMDMEGYVLTIADSRLVFDEPFPDVPCMDDVKHLYGKVEYFYELERRHFARFAKIRTLIKNAKREIITLPAAGKTFKYQTLSEVTRKIDSLRKTGYNVPKYLNELLETELR